MIWNWQNSTKSGDLRENILLYSIMICWSGLLPHIFMQHANRKTLLKLSIAPLLYYTHHDFFKMIELGIYLAKWTWNQTEQEYWLCSALKYPYITILYYNLFKIPRSIITSMLTNIYFSLSKIQNENVIFSNKQEENNYVS